MAIYLHIVQCKAHFFPNYSTPCSTISTVQMMQFQ